MDEMEQLAYKNRFVRQLVQTMTDFEASTATPQIVSGPDNMIILQVSLEEWIKLTSSVFTGADICYPDESDSVRWILFRAVEQPVDLCALIAACIENSPATRAAIRDLVLTDPEINQHISDTAMHITEGLIAGKIIEGSCDKSVVAGKVVAIVERMNDTNVDFLEIVEVGTNDEERVANVVQAIPGLGETPANEIIDFLQDILEDFSENYNAAVTEDWKDEVEEDLYCLARQQEDCSLTYQQLFDYFQGRVGSGLTVQSVIQNVIQFVLNGDFPTDDLVASGLYAIQLAFILAGQEFAGMNVPKIGSLTRDAAPSTKWEDWDECGTPGVNCFSPNYASYHGYGTLLETTETYLIVQATIDGMGRYGVEAGDVSRTTFCLFDGYDITAGAFNAISSPFPEGFVGWSTGGTNITDRSATGYQMCLFSYLSSTAFTLKLYLS